MKKMIIAAVAALTLAGCNMTDGHARWLWNTPDAGVVHGSNYTPAHYDTGTQCSGTGTSQICVPTTTYVGPEWDLDLYAKDGDHGWTSVSERAYNSCHKGDNYPECEH